MGLSASQARLLSITGRMHDIEYKAQNLEAQKLQMANESTQVYKEYEAALNKQKVQFKQIGTDGAATYVDASLQTLLKAGYKIKILSGSNWYDYAGAADAANEKGNWHAYANNAETVTDIVADAANDRAAGSIVKDAAGKSYKLAEDLPKTETAAKAYKEVTDEKATEGLALIDLTDINVLRNLVEAGFIVFEKPMRDGSFSEVNIATDTSLQEVSDETELKKAEAKYEADMRKIDAKDKKFDTDLAAMEAERNALKTELDTLKSVAKDNVDRTFKLFS